VILLVKAAGYVYHFHRQVHQDSLGLPGPVEEFTFRISPILGQSRNKAGRVKITTGYSYIIISDLGEPDAMKIRVYFRFAVPPVSLLSGGVIFSP